MENDDKKLKLIYVNKIGYNAKGEGLFEFIFSFDPSNIDIEGWCWDMSPACDNAMPPTEEFINSIYNLKTSTFDLFCLHEAVDREYMHGYHTIHALAYEIPPPEDDTNGYSDYQKMFENEDDDTPLLVFHYGITLAKIKEMLNSRKIIAKDNEFVEVSSLKI
jgi:hypothetical protein